MLCLRELQDQFARSIFERADTQILPYVVSSNLKASERVDIYRNNVLINYRNALRDTYPVIVRLVGDDFFNAAARVYARRTASGSGDLHDYGEDFGEFLRDFSHARDLPYLPDVARLEWSVHRVFHAADPESRAVFHLASIDETKLPDLRLSMQPTSRLVESDFPILRIWQISQPDYSGEDSVALDEGPDRVLVTRRDYAVEMRRMSKGEYVTLRDLARGAAFGDALDGALSADAEFDLEKFLRDHIVAFTPKSTEQYG